MNALEPSVPLYEAKLNCIKIGAASNCTTIFLPSKSFSGSIVSNVRIVGKKLQFGFEATRLKVPFSGRLLKKKAPFASVVVVAEDEPVSEIVTPGTPGPACAMLVSTTLPVTVKTGGGGGGGGAGPPRVCHAADELSKKPVFVNRTRLVPSGLTRKIAEAEVSKSVTASL